MFEVGDEVYSKRFGEGVVEHIDDPNWRGLQHIH